MEMQKQRMDEPGRAQVAHFMERLMVLPLAKWYEIARDAPADLAAGVAWALSRALSDPGDAWEIWHTRDDVETVLYRFESAEGHGLLRGHVGLPRVREVTERAALALLVRGSLTLAVFDACYGPFAAATPMPS